MFTLLNLYILLSQGAGLSARRESCLTPLHPVGPGAAPATLEVPKKQPEMVGNSMVRRVSPITHGYGKASALTSCVYYAHGCSRAAVQRFRGLKRQNSHMHLFLQGQDKRL
jgi:hypothetical protein